MNEEVIFPLHPAQYDVYTDQLLDTKSPHYNIGGYIKLKGYLNKELFYETVRSGPQVFDAFKMRFDLAAPDPGFFMPGISESMEVVSIDFSEEENAEKKAMEWMQDRFNTPFTIDKKSVLYEQYLLTISHDESWFFGKYHHLITDGYGFVVWVQYLAQKYKSLTFGDNQAFVFNPYLDEVKKGDFYKDSVDFKEDSTYWKNKITAKPEKILQRKYHNSTKKSGSFTLALSEKQRKVIDDIQHETKVRLHHLTIASLLIYFGKTLKETGFVFGIPVHKRTSREARNIVGMFSGIMPFQGDYEKDSTLTDLLKTIVNTQKQDYRYQNYPIGDLARALKVSASDGYLFDVTVNYKLLNFDLSFGEGIEATICELSNEFQKMPLQLCWQDFGPQQPLQLSLDYSTEYFTSDEIKLLADRIIFILEQFPGALNEKVENLQLIPPSENLLIKNFNNNTGLPVHTRTIVDLFETQASLSPGSTSLIFEDKKITYAELNERSNQLARFLIKKGVCHETFVPICMTRSIEMMVGILAVLKAGGAYVPIDPQYPLERMEYMLEDTGATLLITNSGANAKVQQIKTVEIFEVDQDGLFDDESKENPGLKLASSSLAYVIYTSGSTGRPKGVMVEHKNVVELIQSQTEIFKIDNKEKILQFSNYCFDASLEQMFLALFNGATLVLFHDGFQLDGDAFQKYLGEQKVTHLHATPSFLENLPLFDSPFLKRVIAGGDVCKRALADRWRSKADFYNEYGPTETTVTCIEYHDRTGSFAANILLPVGIPLTNVHVYILDENMKTVPLGISGEIFIGGVQVARGYLNRPELTAERFIPNAFDPSISSRLYKTGDLGRWLTDGNIEYQGRIDEQVKVRGYRIELGEIESILQQSEMVRQAAVVAREDQGNEKRLIAYIVPLGKFDRQAIIAYLKSKLPGYMIPSLILEIAEMPITTNGKVNKKVLPEPQGIDLAAGGYQAPGTVLEEKLVELWQEILQVERVGVLDNFFELGGHSLTAMQLTSRIHKLLSIKIEINKIFSNPTIKELAEVLAMEEYGAYIPISSLPEKKYYDLSHAQKRFWILSHYKDGSKAFNFSGAYSIRGSLDIEAFSRALQRVINRHEILRTIFVEVDGEPRQEILTPDKALVEVQIVSLSEHQHADAIIKEAKERELSTPYNLATGPLLRVTLFELSNEQRVLLFSIHHIISDGWSKDILLREILAFYSENLPGQESRFPDLPIQYKDYAAWHFSIINSQKGYWEKMFIDSVPVLQFPTDYERPAVLSFLGGAVQHIIPESLTLSLRALATKHSMSLNNLLFSLYGLLVSQYSGQDDVVVGALSAGRSHLDLENLIGVFINFLPVRLHPQSRLALPEFLGNCNVALLDAYNHQDYPFDLMVDEFSGQRDFSRNPFFDTMVNFHSENSVQNASSFIENSEDNPGIHLKPYHISDDEVYQSVLDFKLDIEPAGNLINLFLSYNSKLFTRERMNQFLVNFIELLTRACENDTLMLREYNKGIFEETGLKQSNTKSIKGTILPVHICASFVAEPLQDYLDYWDKELDLNISLSFAPYNQVFQQLLDPRSPLNTNAGITVLFVRIEDWLREKAALTSGEQLAFLHTTWHQLVGALESVNANKVGPFLVAVVPAYNSSWYSSEVSEAIKILATDLESKITTFSRMNLINLEEVFQLYDVSDVIDFKSDKIGHIPFTQEAYAAIGTFVARKIKAYKGPSYKVIALDCDNTLWKGICGEVGALNVEIDQHFSNLQDFMLQKYNEGFLIALCSKNNEVDVWEVFDNHPGMKLKREHIAAYRINWDLKSINMLSLAAELNLGIDSFIFLDDNEFETEQMELSCPTVLSFALPADLNTMSDFLAHNWAFDTFRITDEDIQRNKRYKVEKERSTEQIKYNSLTDFLESLEIKVTVREMDTGDIERAFQLCLRTNQFNLNGTRKSQQEILEIFSKKENFNRIIEVSDRFGDYGIVGVIFASIIGEELVAETFLLSCRVLGRNVEDLVVGEMQNFCMSRDLKVIRLQYQATEKNKPFREFLDRTSWTTDHLTNDFARHVVSNSSVTA